MQVQQELDKYTELHLDSARLSNLTGHWQSILQGQRPGIIEGNRLNIESLKNFRRLFLFLEDLPTININLRNMIYGVVRSQRKCLIESLRVLKEFKYDSLLKKYPCHPAGNPLIFRYEGYEYTYGWLKNVYHLGLMQDKLGNLLNKNFHLLDLGGQYGTFCSLVKKEYPDSHCILVDFPEQLLHAYYFLKACFPDARIAGIKEIYQREKISRDFIEGYDFVLVPVTFYERLERETVDMYANFVSLGEMKKEWFDYYLNSPPFLTARYFFTINRVISALTYDNNITILDYPVFDRDKRMHFATFPIPHYKYQVKYRHSLFYKEISISNKVIFEYMGRL